MHYLLILLVNYASFFPLVAFYHLTTMFITLMMHRVDKYNITVTRICTETSL